jgi:hypothetical protein
VCGLHRLAESIYCLNWTKLPHILKGTAIDWHKARLISKLYVDRSVKVKLEQGETGSVKVGRGVKRKGAVCHLCECLAKNARKGCLDFKTGGQVVLTAKYADDLLLLAKKRNGTAGHD